MGGQYELKDGATKKYYSIAGMTVATQDASGLQYLLTDHLGSTVAVTDSNGTLTSQQRYLPFGGVRSIPNSPILSTDFGYTGQRLLDAGMGGIMDYKFRMYSPVLGRFISPDSIIPNPANPQSLNRFTYVVNNPVSFNDPTGHRECYVDDNGEDYCLEKPKKKSTPLTPGGTPTSQQDQEYKKLNWFIKWLGYGYQDCELTYTECFNDYSLLKLTENQQIDQDQFNDLVYAVYYDLKAHKPSQWNPLDWAVRRNYDTPFWNGTYFDESDPDFVEVKSNPDTVVCFGSRCDERSDVNYFAQGMWDAAMGRTLEQSLATAQDYKEEEYPGETLSDDAKYWIEFGYQAYLAFDAQPVDP